MVDPADPPTRLTARSAAVLDALATERFSSPELFRLQVAAERLTLIAAYDELVCLDKLTFQPFDYQIRAAQTALRRFRGRGLLCDEVGLGKTIEAGLVLKEYLLRGMVRRVLVLTPPGLVEQWREELATKFGLTDFATHTDEDFRAADSQAWVRFPRVIASLATARQARHRAVITDLVYDLVIVDEAHHLKNRASVTWKFVNALQKKFILLLTATPVQNSLDELYNLITILKPGQLKTHREFRRQFVAGGGDPRLPKNRGRLRELLADVMVRHSRVEVSMKLPPRRAHTVRLDLSSEERALYRDVSELVRAIIAPASDSPESDLGGIHLLTLRTLQREIGSSPAAARPTLEKLAANERFHAHRQRLLELAERAGQAKGWSKGKALDQLWPAVLRDPEERVILFTHFRATLDLLADRLARLGIDFVVYHGSLAATDKTEAIERFRDSARVLLSTEAAGEGRNLQFCRTMINFDLPWNPMRIEQRVGRLHRIGQTRPVEIYNLSARGTVEDYLLDILDKKINIFELVIGEMGMILGELGDEQDFEALLLEVWTRAGNEAELRHGMAELGDALARARQTYQAAQAYDEALFGEDFTAAG